MKNFDDIPYDPTMVNHVNLPPSNPAHITAEERLRIQDKELGNEWRQRFAAQQAQNHGQRNL